MTSHKINKKYEYTIFYRIAELIYTGFFINTGIPIPSCMDKSGGSILESPQSMHVDVSGVALKETDYIALECQVFDASDVGSYEIVMVDHLRKKPY